MQKQMEENRNRVTEGSIVRSVFSLAIPASLGLFMIFILNLTNMFWVGKIGPEAQDAVNSATVVIWPMFALMSIVSIGLTALVSRAIGGKDYAQASFYARQGILFSAGIALVTSVIGIVAAPWLLSVMGAVPETLNNALPYLRIFFASALMFTLIDTSYAIFRAAGDTKTPAKIGILVVTINIILDPLLIFGIGPFPELGVPGASLSTAISESIGLALISRCLLSGRLGLSIGNVRSIRPHWESIRKIARIGLPTTVQHLSFALVYWFLIDLVHSFGVSAGAAMGIGNRMESFGYLTCTGFSIAAATMVGQNLGAGKPDRAAKCAWGAAGLGVAVTAIMSILFLTLSTQIAAIFSDDQAVIAITSDYLIILGLSQLTMALEIVLEGAFNGAGDTLPVMIVMLPGALIRIPMAYFLANTLGWGINGVWWTLTISTTIKALILAYWFSLNKWQAKKV
ncbi:MAG: MATE family efflux transporter [candidate division Zixibacteria bacterium]|nr:MATE family efflux transporter [candidate division Zixibacteria bacterium]